MDNQALNQLLRVLKIKNDITNVTSGDVNTAFRKEAKNIHPDKAGDESTAEFQQLLAAYNALREYFKERSDLSGVDVHENDNDNDDEQFFKDNFEKFNFPYANKGSFTIGIEDSLVDTWQNCMESLLGVPKVVINPWGTECDRS